VSDINAILPPKAHDVGSPTCKTIPNSVVELSRIRPPWPLPFSPSASVMQGYGSPEETREELHRMISSLHQHLQLSNHVLEIFPVRAQSH
jgi:hypothetical protein